MSSGMQKTTYASREDGTRPRFAFYPTRRKWCIILFLSSEGAQQTKPDSNLHPSHVRSIIIELLYETQAKNLITTSEIP